MTKYIMALDQGTTSSRCIIYDHQGQIVSVAQKDVTQIYPSEGWVEQDPMEIWSTQMGVAQEALFKVNGTYKDIGAIGITNQRETMIVWDKYTGEPVYNAIVWQCRRSAAYCDFLKEEGYTNMIREKTGLLPDPYFSGTKLKWVLDNVSGAKEKANKGQLLFGTIETWIIWKLTEGQVHVTDFSNASRTMMFNINTLEWDDDLLSLLDIPPSLLAKPVGNSQVYGYTSPRIFGGSVPIGGAAGDQQSALFGQRCFMAGEGKMTYGTGGFMLVNTGDKPVLSSNGLLTTIGWEVEGQIKYALEGSVFIAGAAVQWLRDEMGLIESSAESEALAASVPDSGGVIFVPAMVGLGAPYWDPYARGSIFGLTRGTKKAHIVRATLEAIAYQTKDLYDAIVSDIEGDHSRLRVDGGASNNDFLMGFQASILGATVIRPHNPETTSLGAAYLAGLSVGFWRNLDEIKSLETGQDLFTPTIDQSQRQSMMDLWHKGVDRSLRWTL